MKFKKIALLLALIQLLVFACACAPGGSVKPSGVTLPGEHKTDIQKSSVISLEQIKIGVILNTNRTDGGWSQSHYDSFMNAKHELGLRDDQLVILEDISENGSETESALELLIADGCNVIFGPSAGHTDPIAVSASRHPDVYFHQFEGQTRDNCAIYSVRDYEAIFVCGYAAARVSSVDQLGFQAAQPTASVVRAINAWATGAKYANPNSKVRVVWTNSWYDPAAEKEGANSMLDSGIECLGYHGSTSAVMQSAEEHGCYATGFHIDMKDYAPKAVLTSFVWNWSPIYVEFIQRIVDGTWTNETVYKGIEEGCAVLAPFNEDLMNGELISECEDLVKRLKDGEIKVFLGPIYDNKNNLILDANKEFSDLEWIGMMYLADNVQGDLP